MINVQLYTRVDGFVCNADYWQPQLKATRVTEWAAQRPVDKAKLSLATTITQRQASQTFFMSWPAISLSPMNGPLRFARYDTSTDGREMRRS